MALLALRSVLGYRWPMGSGGSSASWFATLRRDRGLFALVGALAILLGLLQPVAAARGAELEGLQVLCSHVRAGVPVEPGPAQGPDCPLCPIGHPCGMHAALAVPAHAPAFRPSLLPDGRPFFGRACAQTPVPGGEAPPSIRAPPLST